MGQFFRDMNLLLMKSKAEVKSRSGLRILWIYLWIYFMVGRFREVQTEGRGWLELLKQDMLNKIKKIKSRKNAGLSEATMEFLKKGNYPW